MLQLSPIIPKLKCLPETDAYVKHALLTAHAKKKEKKIFFFCFSDYLTDVPVYSDPKF